MEEIAQQYMIDHVTNQVKNELRRAEAIHGGFASLHEAIAIIREEFLELEREIFWGIQKTKRLDGIRSEAIQLCAMSLRLAVMVSHVPKEAYERRIGPQTDRERRLLESLKEHIHPKYPNFCEVCYAQTENAPDECHCDFKNRWLKAKALVEEFETPQLPTAEPARQGLTDLERRLYGSLRFHVSRQEPRFCKVCVDSTTKPQEKCGVCPFKREWETALALLEECKQKYQNDDSGETNDP